MKKIKKIWRNKFFIIITLFCFLKIFFIDFVTIHGKSMENTMFNGDKVLVLKLFNINRFDIVVLNSEDKTKLYIKRVIGLPGDKIEFKEQKLYINDIFVDETYIKDDSKMKDLVIDRVPDNSYFVLGDNRNHSKNSRTIGFIDKKDIILKPIFNFWPFDRLKLF